MASLKPVHECLFCPQTFDSATAKDDHVLEHFAQETCTECNQHLIRIGSTLYSQHNSTTCIRIDVKLEAIDKSSSDTPSAPENVIHHESEGSLDDENHSEDNVPILTSIEMDEIQIKDEPNEEDEQQDTFKSLSDYEQANSSRTSQIERISVFNSEENTHKNREFEYDLNECKNSQNQFECKICNMKFKLKNNLSRHMKGMHDPCADKYKCKICHQVYLTESTLQSHKCICRKVPTPCDDCGKILSSRRALQEHQTRLHSPVGTIFCNGCSKKFASVEDLNQHKSVCKHRQCDICGKILSSKFSLRTHKALLHSQQCNEFQCHLCELKFKMKNALRKHMIRVHDADKEKLKCKICYQVYLKESSLQSHRCSGVPVPCDECGEILGSARKLRTHKARFHSSRTIFCNGCAKIFTSIEDLNQHKAVCNSNNIKEQSDIGGSILSNEFECYACKMKFKLESDLRMHIFIKHDSNIEKFKCKLCYRTFVKQSSFRFHLCHGKEICEICGNVLSNAIKLREHQIRLHSQKGTIFCIGCTKIFSRIEDLDTHRMACKRYLNRLARKNKLRNKNVPATCEICGKTLSSKSALRTHTNLLHNEQCVQFECNICKKKFKLKDGLRKHMIRKHDPDKVKRKCNSTKSA